LVARRIVSNMASRATVLFATALACVLARADARAFTASSCAPPKYACAGGAPTLGDATRCHASWACRIVCSPGASCAETFTIRAGIATVPDGTTVAFNASEDALELGPTTFGGDASCTAVGCDSYATRLTAQNVAYTRRYDGNWCEVKETSERCKFEGAPKDERWTEFTVTMKCRNKILPCTGARAVAEVDFLGVVGPSAPSPPTPPEPPRAPPTPPTPPMPPPPPGTFSPGGAGRRRARAALIVVLVSILIYAAFGSAYVYALGRGWVEGFVEPCWEREGSFCEMVWCWCFPAYWRASDQECLDAYEASNERRDRTGDFRHTQTTAPLLNDDSDSTE